MLERNFVFPPVRSRERGHLTTLQRMEATSVSQHRACIVSGLLTGMDAQINYKWNTIWRALAASSSPSAWPCQP